MSEHVENIERGARSLSRSRAVRLLLRGVTAINRLYWSFIALFNPYHVMSGYFILTGAVLIKLVNKYPGAMLGLDGITHDNEQKNLIAFGFVVLGWLISMVRRRELLTVGSMVAFGYALATASTINQGEVNETAWTAVIYIAFATVGICSFASSEAKTDILRARYEKRLELHERREAQLVAHIELIKSGAANGKQPYRQIA